MLPATAALCLIWFLKPIKKLFLLYFSEIYSIFFLDGFFHIFIPLRKVGDLYAPPCMCVAQNASVSNRSVYSRTALSVIKLFDSIP